jgi:hypothetical protein
LTFHLPTERGNDPTHGDYVSDRAHIWRVTLGGKYPELAVGTYEDKTLRRAEQRSLCYADALGATSDDSSAAQIDDAKVVIRSRTPTTIAGAILSHDGAFRLDFDAPIRVAGFPKEGPICCFGGPVSASSKLAPACVSKPSGTFTADPSFAFDPNTELQVFVDERHLSDRLGAFVRLEFRGPATANRDPYGEARHRTRTTITAPIDAPYPAVPDGTYSTSSSKSDETEVCYPNGLGYWDASVNAPLGDGTLTISSPGPNRIAGVLDVAGRKIEFRAPITPAPVDVATRPNCCRE